LLNYYITTHMVCQAFFEILSNFTEI